MKMSPTTFIVLPCEFQKSTQERSNSNMHTTPMTHVESNVGPRKSAGFMGLLACLIVFAAASLLNGQKTKSPSSKTQTGPASSAAPVRVAQPHGHAVAENDWRQEVMNNSSAPVT